MKFQKNIKQMLLLTVATIWVVGLSSCTTANNAAKTKAAPNTAAESSNQTASKYRAVAKAVTDQCPMKVDELTNLAALEYKEEQHALVYVYRVSRGVFENMDEQSWAIVEKTTENMLRESLKTNQMLAQLRADNLTLVFMYNDQNGKELFTITFDPGTY